MGLGWLYDPRQTLNSIGNRAADFMMGNATDALDAYLATGDPFKAVMYSMRQEFQVMSVASALMAVAGGAGNTFGFMALGAGALASYGNNIGQQMEGKRLGAIDGGIAPSQTFSWSPATIQQQGTPIPRVYGITMLYGNVVASSLRAVYDDATKEYLSASVCLADGPLSALLSIKVNNLELHGATPNPAISWANRPGVLTQPTSYGPAFQNLYNTYTDRVLAVGNQLVAYGSPITFQTVNSDYRALMITLLFPKGIGRLTGTNSIASHSIGIRIEILSPVGAVLYTLNETFTNNKSQQLLITRGWMPLQEALPGRCSVRVTKTTADQPDVSYSDTVLFSTVEEQVDNVFTYPGKSMFYVAGIASSLISGTFDLECIAKGRPMRIFDGAAWTIAYCDNPAWVCYDVLSQPIIDGTCRNVNSVVPTGPGGGVHYTEAINYTVVRYDGYDPSQLDAVAFKAWADWCDTLVPDGNGGTEKRFTFNGSFDTDSNPWDTALKIAGTYRTWLVMDGGKLSVVVDQATSQTQRPLFTMGNILAGSFKETFLPWEDRATHIEVDFLNVAKNYQRDKFQLFNPDAATSTAGPVALNLVGITKASEAWRVARFLLLQNQYICRAVEFQADIDSIDCTVGTVFDFQHDVPMWGCGGRIVLATANSVTLDKAVTIVGGKTYQVKIRLADNSTIMHTVTTGAGTTATLAITPNFVTNPAQFDLYAFGETNKLVKPFRITSIEKTSDLHAKVVGIEYNESLYGSDTGAPVIPGANYSTFSPTITITCDSVGQIISLSEAGVLQRETTLSYTVAPNPLYSHAEIYLGPDGAPGEYLSRADYGNFTTKKPLIELSNYRFTAVPVKKDGSKLAFADAPSLVFTAIKFQTGNSSSNLWGSRPTSLYSLAYKQITRSEWERIAGTATTTGEKIKLDTQANLFPGITAITSAKTDLNTAYLDLGTWLNNGVNWTHNPAVLPALIDDATIEMNSIINTAFLRLKLASYNITALNLTNAIAVQAATTASWVGVSGLGKPEDNATVGADSTNLKTGKGVNLCKNPGFNNASRTGWTVSTANPDPSNSGVNLDIVWSVKGGNTFYLQQVGNNQSAYFEAYSEKIPVTVGKPYEYYAFLGSHRCVSYVLIRFYAIDDSFISNSTGVDNGCSYIEKNGGPFLTDYKQAGGIFTAPTGTAYARLILRKMPTATGSDSYMFATQCYLGEAGVAQTEYSPWNAAAPIDNTTQLIDGAGLGNTANWQNVTNKSVQTQEIAANAVTNQVITRTSGYEVLEAAADRDVLSMNFTATTSNVLVEASGRFERKGQYLSVYIVRDGNTLITGSCSGTTWSFTISADGDFNLSLTDTPSIGAHTYKVHIFTTQSTSCSLGQVILKATEFKR